MNASPAGGRRGGVHHPLFARCYTRFAPLGEERLGLAEHRRQLLSGLSGRVVEIGAGSGLNFRYYPSGVSQVVAVEPERLLHRAAAEAAGHAPVPVQVVPGTGEALPLRTGAFDAVVACLVLCSVRDQQRTLREVRRVLRPGGELRLLEHVRASSPAAVAMQWAADRTLWPLVFGGCHTGRDTLANVESAGFDLGPVRRLRIPDGRLPVPSAPHVLTAATRPEH